MMGAVFAMQGIGQLCGALVMLFVTLGFKESLSEASTRAKCTGDCQLAVDKMWRTLIGFGAVPAVIALYCKSLRLPPITTDYDVQLTNTLARPSYHSRDPPLHL